MTADPPDVALVRTLPTSIEKAVPPEAIDENGHMNITAYFADGAWGVWRRLGELGMGEHYIPERGLSFFTVEHHLRYLSELRLGEPYSVRSGFAGRTAKAVHGVAYVVDEARGRLACSMEILYVHVSMATRRSAPIPDDLAAALDGEIAAHPWVADVATGLTLRR